MKISDFLNTHEVVSTRQGFATNSSSSHSVVWSDTPCRHVSFTDLEKMVIENGHRVWSEVSGNSEWYCGGDDMPVFVYGSVIEAIAQSVSYNFWQNHRNWDIAQGVIVLYEQHQQFTRSDVYLALQMAASMVQCDDEPIDREWSRDIDANYFTWISTDRGFGAISEGLGYSTGIGPDSYSVDQCLMKMTEIRATYDG